MISVRNKLIDDAIELAKGADAAATGIKQAGVNLRQSQEFAGVGTVKETAENTGKSEKFVKDVLGKYKTEMRSTGLDSGVRTGKYKNPQRGKYVERLNYLHAKYGKLTAEEINQQINLRSETKKELERLKLKFDGRPNFGKDKLGPALAGVFDKTTGEYYYAINTFDGAVPDLVPLLKDRLNNIPKEILNSYNHLSKGAGSHAEVIAVNNALKANPTAKIEDLIVNVIRTGINKKKPGGAMFKCCPHCSYLLDGFKVVSEVSKNGR